MTKRPTASLGRRLLPALAMTTAASGLVALLDRPSSGAAIDLGSDAAVSDTAAGAPAATAPVVPPTVSSTLPAVAQQPAATSQPATAQPATSQPATTQPAAASSSGACEGKTLDGPVVDTRWGPVQVEAVVSTAGQICDVDAIQSPNSHGRSVRINDEALPILRTQVLKAQSANINGVSGATVTTRGYERSLQSILDSVG